MVSFLTHTLSNFCPLNAVVYLREYSTKHDCFINLSGEELGKGYAWYSYTNSGM